MRKFYIIDLILLVINIICLFGYTDFVKSISMNAIIIFSIFITLQIFVNLRFKIVMKYVPEFNPSWKEYLYISALFLSKIQFLLVILNDTSSLYWSVLHLGFLSLFILDYSYVSKDRIVYSLKRAINLNDINNIKIKDSLFSSVHINASLKNNKEIKFKLNEEEYKYLQNRI